MPWTRLSHFQQAIHWDVAFASYA